MPSTSVPRKSRLIPGSFCIRTCFNWTPSIFLDLAMIISSNGKNSGGCPGRMMNQGLTFRPRSVASMTMQLL